jgi:hypothetical protein
LWCCCEKKCKII